MIGWKKTIERPMDEDIDRDWGIIRKGDGGSAGIDRDGGFKPRPGVSG